MGRTNSVRIVFETAVDRARRAVSSEQRRDGPVKLEPSGTAASLRHPSHWAGAAGIPGITRRLAFALFSMPKYVWMSKLEETEIVDLRMHQRRPPSDRLQNAFREPRRGAPAPRPPARRQSQASRPSPPRARLRLRMNPRCAGIRMRSFICAPPGASLQRARSSMAHRERHKPSQRLGPETGPWRLDRGRLVPSSMCASPASTAVPGPWEDILLQTARCCTPWRAH